jgi:hypothetical protein
MSSSSVAARLEARASAAPGSERADNATVASGNHAAAAAFLAAFEQRRRNIEAALSKLDGGDKQAPPVAGATPVAANAADALKEVTAQVAQLSLDTSAHTHLLPAYDVRATKTALAALDEALATAQAALQPRKKFAFRKKTVPFANSAVGRAAAAAATQAAASVSAAAPAASSSSIDAAGSAVAPGAAAIAASPAAASAGGEALPPEDPVHGFYRQTGRVLVKSGGACSGVDVVLSHLRDCVVFILDPPLALRCHNLQNCAVYCAPVSGSVLIYGARHCTIHVAARQLRIHDTHATSFHLHAISAPIIEHTDSTAFGPLDFAYPAMEEHMARAGLAGKPSKHDTVEDFNWLRAQQSPNWRRLADDSAEEAATRPSPVALTQQHIDSMLPNMRDDEQVDEGTRATLDRLVKELRIRRTTTKA